MLLINFTKVVLLASALGCARTQEPRDASSFEYKSVATEFAAATPGALTAADQPTGPTACAAPDCPTLAAVLKPLFDTVAEDSPATILARVDQRMNEVADRTTDHYVSCLEEDGVVVPATLGAKVTLDPVLNCYADYDFTESSRSGVGFEQLVFGRSNSSPLQSALRLGIVEDDSAALWTSRNVDSGQLDVWRATSRGLANEGKTYMHVRVGPGSELQAVAVGSGQFIGDNQFACGLQVRGDADRLYVKGRFFPTTDVSFARDPAACAALEPVAFCVLRADLAVEDTGNCTSAGLDTFTLTELLSEDLGGEEWGTSVTFDYSELLQRFRLSGLDIYGDSGR